MPRTARAAVGGLHGAGGVGGLVGVQDLTTGRTYAVVHDAAFSASSANTWFH